jgi:pilus assembly protein CpaC
MEPGKLPTTRSGRAIRRVLAGAAVFALQVPLAAVPAQAQNGEQLHAGALEVPLNKSQVVSADRPIAKAMIGNAAIADVLPVTDRSVYVLGKAVGTTSLTLYDAVGRVLTIMDIAVGPDVQSFRDQVVELLPGEEVNARLSGDSMVLTGLVSGGAAADRAMQLAKTFAGDKVVNMLGVRASEQIMLEVKFAEVSRSVGKDIGVSAFGAGSRFDMVTGSGAQLVPDPTTGLGVMKLSAINNTFGVFRSNFNIGSLSINSILNALESKGMAKTLAEPTLVALSGEKASFLAGGEFPIPVVQSGSGGGSSNGQAITVEFKPFGVSLGFTPTVLGDKTINLIVEPEVSSIDPTASITLNGITIPGLQTRRASTTLELRDGESFAIAGLLQRDFKTTARQLPLLGSIPILGALFRSAQFQKGETELLIVVTPRLVAPVRPDQIKLPTDRVKDPTDVEVFLKGEPYTPQSVTPSGEKPAPAKKKGDGYEY